MWLFDKLNALKEKAAQEERDRLLKGLRRFSQLDIPQEYRQDKKLKLGEWITTFPLNEKIPNPTQYELPPIGTSADELYRVADKMSVFRETHPLPNDGVYCPICHKATIGLDLLRKPCPTCGRNLLKFGWE